MRALTLITASMPGMRRHTDDGKTPSGRMPMRTMSKVRRWQSRETAAVAEMAEADVEAACLQANQGFVEARELEQGESFVEFVGLREVAECAFELQRFSARMRSATGNTSFHRAP